MKCQRSLSMGCHINIKTQRLSKTTYRNTSKQEMKLAWSPERASKAYIDTVQACVVSRESGVAEFISAMAAGWNSQLIVETWSQGGAMATSVGLAVARSHTCGRHVCVVPDERAGSEYAERMGEAGVAAAEVVVGEAEEVMEGLVGVDFLVVDGGRRDFPRVVRLAKLSSKGAVLVCKNACSASNKGLVWRSLVAQAQARGSRRVVRSVFLPVGKGLDMAHVSASSASAVNPSPHRWIKHVDQQSGDVHFIRT